MANDDIGKSDWNTGLDSLDRFQDGQNHVEEDIANLSMSPTFSSLEPESSLFSATYINAPNLEGTDNDLPKQKSADLQAVKVQRPKKKIESESKGRKKIARIVCKTVIIVLIVLILVAAGSFSFFRWAMNDDYADLQGKWLIGDSGVKVTITEDMIKLNEDVVYSYEIDSMSKTLTFDFGQLEGSGRYRFSIDRNQLSLLDGSFGSVDTLLDDIPWSIQAMWDYLFAGTVDSPNLGEGGISLSRVVEE